MAKTGRDSAQQMLRLPGVLRERIKREAETNGRSMNAEIVERLEFSLRAHSHASILRTLIEMHGDLLAGKVDLDIPPHIENDIVQIAKRRGMPAQKLLVRLLVTALRHLDDETLVGEELANRILKNQDDPTPEDPTD